MNDAIYREGKKHRKRIIFLLAFRVYQTYYVEMDVLDIWQYGFGTYAGLTA